ncbi:FIST N-terminal domain-containing protein [Dinoroseobacter sp. PD6]|uniref:FIST N-terminal domain-containing protein n=1 Tax=Dinoroseobacter sp. PD6 TaxID=3028384 RepID=UPI00237C3933|nr:FIST N-terminal domain-containing protein [Dinoroseobacter sp. PD6]MDD9717412.1 FIST N-terminal domain-containing protein [Dinoroseobacter sp. PD6]
MRDHLSDPSIIQVAVSRATAPQAAADDAASKINLPETRFVLAFVPGEMPGDEVAAALDTALDGVPVFGCSTAGQITDKGYETEALLLLAFPKKHFRCSSLMLAPLDPISPTALATTAQRHENEFQHTAGWNRLGLIFSDGVSQQEDVLVSTLEAVLSDLPIFGGSAGDSLRFEKTFVLHKGASHSNSAVLLILETDLEFQGVGFDHFLPSGAPLVITGADPEARKVYEINGAPAAEEYARLVGCKLGDLSPKVFAENPMLVQYRDRHYVRAISDADDAGALSFMAAIDDGLIMTLGKGQEILQTLETGLRRRDRRGERPDFILGFDCVLRKLEIEQKQLARAVSNILCSSRVFGYNTYGEQYCGVHMNQTFVGVAFFKSDQGYII